ncbi:MAG TPA: protein-glutamate O-methyltransferase CheR [Pyrinomonadaceae bacterium]|nr:protein-glutamate O-methyltransferase CheR [Pyrinomonadaceae bacterium]
MTSLTDSGEFVIGQGAAGRGAQMSESAFVLLRDLIYVASGIYFDDASRASLERRLRPRVEALRLESFEQYYQHLKFGEARQEELQRALDSVTVQETYFFREERALRAFREEILPEVAERRRAEQTLRVWSAGCSTGEEAYTLAMLVEESGLFDGWRVELSASDLIRRVIEEARRGLYAEKSFRTTDPARREKYFTPRGDGTFLVAETLRAAVDFGCFNLVDTRPSDPHTDLDVIFCRNVMLYFGTDARRRTIAALHRQLRPGGYLVLGASESLFTLDAPFRLAHLRHDLVYQK